MATLDAVSVERAFAAALAEAWAEAMAQDCRLVAAEAPAGGIGWAVEVALTGSARGRLVAWFPRETAIRCVRDLKGAADAIADTDVTALLQEIVARATKAFAGDETYAAITFGEPSVSAGVPPAEGGAHTLQAGEARSSAVITHAEVFPQASQLTRAPQAAATGDLPQLDAVLDVELPLLVRFGQVSMPLQALADLGPGSVVDMGRSPEEPVELLVGSRVIARGEVVVVSGNYGIRITELTAAAPTLRDVDTRAS